jgi:hypothetical protein
MLYPTEKVDAVPKSLRIASRTEQGSGQTVTFVLAIGSVRQACRLQTRFRTKNEAFGYFYKRRTEFERVARASLAHGDIEDGVIELTML